MTEFIPETPEEVWKGQRSTSAVEPKFIYYNGLSKPRAPVLLIAETVALPPVYCDQLSEPSAQAETTVQPSAPDFGGPCTYKYQLVFFLKNGKCRKGTVTDEQVLMETLPARISRKVKMIEAYSVLCRVSDGKELDRVLIAYSIYGSDV